MKNIVIVGSGPCGMTSAIAVKKNHPEYQVILLEKDKSIGKRIKVSGNGRCNFCNEYVFPEAYHLNEDSSIFIMIDEFLKESSFFNYLNIHSYADEEGRMYPLTNSSQTILNAFKRKLTELGVDIRLETEFISFTNNNSKIIIKTSKGDIICDNLILATGGTSYLYNDSVHKLLNNKDINITPLVPSLCPIVVEEKIPHNVVGKRARVKIKLLKDGEIKQYYEGELIFKKDGISGIVIFEISFDLASLNLKENKYEFEIDFAPEIDDKVFKHELETLSKYDALSNYVVDEIASFIDFRYKNAIEGLHHFKLTFKELYPFKDSQVTHGGVSLDEIDLNTFSLKKNPQVYIGGELLDVDGTCGGYNILFAISSGYKIGNSID